MAIDIKRLDIKKLEKIFEEIKTIKNILAIQNEVLNEYDAYFNSEAKQNLGLITEALKAKFEELNEIYKTCIVIEQTPQAPVKEPAKSNDENNDESQE